MYTAQKALCDSVKNESTYNMMSTLRQRKIEGKRAYRLYLTEGKPFGYL